MFKLISQLTGTVLTLGSIYIVQKKTAELIKSDPFIEDEATTGRVISSFATAVIVGGTIDKIIRHMHN